MTEPLEVALQTSDLILDPAPAACTLPVLAAASRIACPHAQQARALLDALIGYDLLVWPRHFAGEHYQVGGWRVHMNSIVAAAVLNGDGRLLGRYLDAFASCPEDLRGL